MLDLGKLFKPKSIAVLGASDRNMWSALLTRAAKEIAFTGDIHMVNHRGTPVEGREAVKSCAEIAGPVDFGFVAVAAARVDEALEDMAAGDIRFGAVLSSGFAEMGEAGAIEQKRVFGRARELGLTLIGPNSIGFHNYVDRVAIGAIPITAPVLDNPRVAIVSQSGSIAATVCSFAHRQNISVSYAVTVGNEAMIGIADVIKYLAADQATRAIAVFAETIRDPLAFEDAARAAAAARKPIVMFKIGTSELTATVAKSHTGAMIGDDRVFQAICDAYNIIRVTSIEDLVITADVMAALAPVDPNKGLGIISISGGACEIIADQGVRDGVPLPQFAPATLEKLAATVVAYGATNNPLDATASVMTRPEIYSEALTAFGSDPSIGLLGATVELPATQDAVYLSLSSDLREISAGFRATGLPSIAIQTTMKPIGPFGRELIARNGLPLVTGGVDHAIRALGLLYRWSRNLENEPPAPRASPPPSSERPLGERQTLAYLAASGVPVIPQALAATRDEAIEIGRRLGGKVALKISSAEIAHKTEVGGVALGIQGVAVGEAYDAMIAAVTAAAPGARIDGVIVAPMRQGGVELLVGVVRDPDWGLTLTVGLGGVLVEVLGDTQLRVLPLRPADIKAMLSRLKAAKLLQGYRGSAPADLDRLAAVIAKIGDAALALGDDLEALEVNPLRVDGAEIEALDALAVWKAA